MAGHGYPIMTGAGLRFITAGGIMIITMDGFGYPITNGDHRGLPGEGLTVIMAGLQCDLELV